MTREIAKTDQDSVQIGPVAIARLSRTDAIRRLLAVPGSGTRLAVAFANAHGLLLAMDDPAFAKALAQFLVLNDGIGAEIGARVLSGAGFEDNLNGTDFVPALLDATPHGTRVYLFGARPEVVEKAAGVFAARHSAITICGWRNGYFGEDEIPEIIADINAARPDILLVAMGNPRQEFLINRLWSDLDVPLALGVGALFDFTAGEVTRAPSLLRHNGLEWVYRLWQEPKRLGQRYTSGIIRYLWKILCLKLSGKSARA